MAVFPDVPKSWVVLKLGDILKDESKSIDPQKTPSSFFELYSIPQHAYGQPEILKGADIGSTKKTVEEGTVLLSKINPRLNRVWIVGNHTSYKKIASSEWIAFFRTEHVFNKFLFFFLQQSKVRDYLASNVSGVGGSLMRVNKSVVSSIPINLPPLPEQHRIVAKLEELFSELDNGIANLKKAQAQLKVYRQAVLKAAFEGKLTEQWRAASPEATPDAADKLLEQIKAERQRHSKKPKEYPPLTEAELKELPALPVGWKWVKSGNIIDPITNGYTPKAEFMTDGSGEIPFIKVYNLTFDGRHNYQKDPIFIPRHVHRNELSRSITVPGDVLINIVGPPLGKVSIVSSQFPEWNINQAIVLFRPNTFIHSEYISYFMQNPFTINWLEGTSKATAGQYNVKVSTCREIPFPLCSIGEQKALIQEIESRLSVCDHLEKEIEKALQQSETLRQSILKKAFEGRLVPQDPEDELAGELLKRIKSENRGGK